MKNTFADECLAHYGNQLLAHKDLLELARRLNKATEALREANNTYFYEELIIALEQMPEEK